MDKHTKIQINGDVHFLDTVVKYIAALLFILTIQPKSSEYTMVNIKNAAIIKLFKLRYDGERSFKDFLVRKELITISKKEKYNSKTKNRNCDKFEINFDNICNFLLALSSYTRESYCVDSIRSLLERDIFSNDVVAFLNQYSHEHCLASLKPIETGMKYNIKECQEKINNFNNKQVVENKEDSFTMLDDSKSISEDKKTDCKNVIEEMRKEDGPMNRYHW